MSDENQNQEVDEQITFKFVQGPQVEIRGNNNHQYTVIFYDKDQQEEVYRDQIHSGYFTRCYREYFVNWNIQIYRNNEVLVKDFHYRPAGRVLITFESTALGDNICWLPMVEEFRKKWGVHVLCSTMYNELFEEVYPDIEFVNRGQNVKDIHSVFRIGWYGNGEASHKNKYDCRIQTLQKLSADILGLDFENYYVTRLKKDKRDPLIKEKYVAITTVSTARAKYWNNPYGWPEVVKYLNKEGYKVVNIGIKPNELEGVVDLTGKRHFNDLLNIIQNCDFFIGVSSGLTWMAWALKKPTVMISGFTKEWNEYENNHRVINKKVCNGCMNWGGDTVFDKGDWMWCPKHKGTSRQFECSKEISSKDVIKHINQIRERLKENPDYMGVPESTIIQ